jgi:hypothetical protein
MKELILSGLNELYSLAVLGMPRIACRTPRSPSTSSAKLGALASKSTISHQGTNLRPKYFEKELN